MNIWEYTIENSTLILSVFIGVILLIVLVKILKRVRDLKLLKTVTSTDRGTRTERDLVLKLLKNGVPAQTIFHDLSIKKGNGDSSQIDLVVATSEGIIVFEVKEYSGWIFGNANHSHWTQVLAYGKQKYRFYNPVKQNNSHIKALKSQLKQFNNIPFYSIIAFYGNCELKEIEYVPQGTYIVMAPRILEVLKDIKNENSVAPYTNKREVIEMLKQAVKNGESIEVQNEHIANINDMLGTDRIYK